MAPLAAAIWHGFGQLAWLHDTERLTLQSSASLGYSELTYRPSVQGELLFNGTAQNAFKNDLAIGWQFHRAWKADPAPTIRFGLFVQHDHSASKTDTWVFPVDGSGVGVGAPSWGPRRGFFLGLSKAI